MPSSNLISLVPGQECGSRGRGGVGNAAMLLGAQQMDRCGVGPWPGVFGPALGSTETGKPHSPTCFLGLCSSTRLPGCFPDAPFLRQVSPADSFVLFWATASSAPGFLLTLPSGIIAGGVLSVGTLMGCQGSSPSQSSDRQAPSPLSYRSCLPGPLSTRMG